MDNHGKRIQTNWCQKCSNIVSAKYNSTINNRSVQKHTPKGIYVVSPNETDLPACICNEYFQILIVTNQLEGSQRQYTHHIVFWHGL